MFIGNDPDEDKYILATTPDEEWKWIMWCCKQLSNYEAIVLKREYFCVIHKG